MERFDAGRKLLDAAARCRRALRMAALAAIAFGLVVSCSKNKAEFIPETPESNPAIATRKAVSAKEHGRTVMCPVTGRVFRVGNESEAAIYKGRVVYFVDAQALEAFLADPSEYDADPPVLPRAPVKMPVE